MKPSQAQNKSDWFYELRPILILIFGIVGLFNHSLATNMPLLRVSQISGFVLILAGLKIIHWRTGYRKERSHSRF